MSETLMEGVIVVLLVWIAWRIGSILAPRLIRRFRGRRSQGKTPPDHENKPPHIIDI